MIAKELKPGSLIRYRNEPFMVVDAKYIKPGNGAGYVETKLKMIRDGRVVRKIFAPSVQLETVLLETKDAKLRSHRDGESIFEGVITGEPVSASHRILGKAIGFIPIGTKVKLYFYDGELLAIDFPKTTPLLVKQLTDNKALLETGAAIKVPSFIKAGDTIVVNPAKGTFLYKL